MASTVFMFRSLADVWCENFFCCLFNFKIVLQLSNDSIGVRKRSNVHRW